MHKFVKLCSSLASVGAFAALLSTSGMAMAQSYATELSQGAHPDTTPQQRYQSAIREAGGGLKVSLAECRKLSAGERKACDTEARASYKKDMDYASELRKNPNARPYSVKGGEVRMTDETPIKP